MTLEFATYAGEHQLDRIMELVSRDLSEPYSIFTYRYFIHSWPHLCITASVDGEIVGVIVGKAALVASGMQGYIAMLAVDRGHRKRGIGRLLILKEMEAMRESCDEVALEVEATNAGALRLYHQAGFMKEKRLPKYYLNGSDAFRMRLWFPGKRVVEDDDAAAAAPVDVPESSDDSTSRDERSAEAPTVSERAL